jgi:hypothetical protein
MLEIDNRAQLTGVVETPPQYDHECAGESFYQMMLRTPRLSGASDVLPLLVPAVLMPQTLQPGMQIHVCGQLRSYHYLSGDRPHLRICVFVKTLQSVFDETLPGNLVCLNGRVHRPPVRRSTPLGREICDLMLLCPRNFGKSDLIPCICWGRSTYLCAAFEPGQALKVTGRLQSRIYQKKIDDQVVSKTAYELSLLHFEALEETEPQPQGQSQTDAL